MMWYDLLKNRKSAPFRKRSARKKDRRARSTAVFLWSDKPVPEGIDEGGLQLAAAGEAAEQVGGQRQPRQVQGRAEQGLRSGPAEQQEQQPACEKQAQKHRREREAVKVQGRQGLALGFREPAEQDGGEEAVFVAGNLFDPQHRPAHPAKRAVNGIIVRPDQRFPAIGPPMLRQGRK